MAASKGKPGVSKREQQVILLVGGLGLVVLWLYFAYIIAPLGRAAAAMGRQLQETDNHLSTLKVVAAREGQLQTQYQQLDHSVTGLRTLLPAEGEVSGVIELLTALANQTQVKILTISPQRSTASKDASTDKADGSTLSASPHAYQDVYISIDALAGYHQLGTFLSLVEAGEKPMRVSTLKISGNPKDPRRSNVKLLITTYLTKAAASSKEAAGLPQPSAPAR